MAQATDNRTIVPRSVGRYLAQVAIVSAAQFGAGRLGDVLQTINNGGIGPVWPASGIALGALLLWGYSVWPGIAAGAFLLPPSVRFLTGLLPFTPLEPLWQHCSQRSCSVALLNLTILCPTCVMRSDSLCWAPSATVW